MEIEQLKNKTVWLYVSPNSKWRCNRQPIESDKVLGRITAINRETITVRDNYNQPHIIHMNDIERVVPTNREFHINYMKQQLESALSCFSS